jgi:hypothetical protein
LAKIGIPGRQIYLLAKPYSTIPAAEEEIRRLGVNVIDVNNVMSVPASMMIPHLRSWKPAWKRSVV